MLGRTGPQPAAGSGSSYHLVPTRRSLAFDEVFGTMQRRHTPNSAPPDPVGSEPSKAAPSSTPPWRSLRLPCGTSQSHCPPPDNHSRARAALNTRRPEVLNCLMPLCSSVRLHGMLQTRDADAVRPGDGPVTPTRTSRHRAPPRNSTLVHQPSTHQGLSDARHSDTSSVYSTPRMSTTAPTSVSGSVASKRRSAPRETRGRPASGAEGVAAWTSTGDIDHQDQARARRPPEVSAHRRTVGAHVRPKGAPCAAPCPVSGTKASRQQAVVAGGSTRADVPLRRHGASRDWACMVLWLCASMGGE